MKRGGLVGLVILLVVLLFSRVKDSALLEGLPSSVGNSRGVKERIAGYHASRYPDELVLVGYGVLCCSDEIPYHSRSSQSASSRSCEFLC